MAALKAGAHQHEDRCAAACPGQGTASKEELEIKNCAGVRALHSLVHLPHEHNVAKHALAGLQLRHRLAPLLLAGSQVSLLCGNLCKGRQATVTAYRCVSWSEAAGKCLADECRLAPDHCQIRAVHFVPS